MKIFSCASCHNPVFFENVQCVSCGAKLAFLPDCLEMGVIALTEEGIVRATHPQAPPQGYRLCANSEQHGTCNWLIAREETEEYCRSCRRNEFIPDLTVPGNRERWLKLEWAKRRLLYSLLELKLPLDGTDRVPNQPLRFRFGADTAGMPPLKTGHAQGVITVNIVEADDAEREARRISLHEPFRTLLGHFRHEVGHYYWDQLILGTPRQARFRELFGDETQDYAHALQRHYQNGPPPDWNEQWISAYACAHPWEDWAETWAHCLHLLDSVETAAGFGLSVRSDPFRDDAPPEWLSERTSDGSWDFDFLIQSWLPLTRAINELNRGMGLPDLYPFVWSKPALDKLRFVHEVIRQAPARVEASTCASQQR